MKRTLYENVNHTPCQSATSLLQQYNRSSQQNSAHASKQI